VLGQGLGLHSFKELR